MRDPQFTRKIGALISKHLPMSRTINEVDDFVQSALLRLIEKNYLSTYIREGREIKDVNIAFFATRTAISQLRKNGRNPVCRTLYGAMTETEQRKGLYDRHHPDCRSQVTFYDEEGQRETHIHDSVDYDSRVSLQELISKIEDLEIAKLVEKKALGYTLKEIAVETGCRQHEVSRLIKSITQGKYPVKVVVEEEIHAMDLFEEEHSNHVIEVLSTFDWYSIL